MTASAKRIELPELVTNDDLRYTRERYTLDQAAEYLMISRSSLYGLVAAGKIAHAIGSRGRKLFSQADLDEFRESRRRGSVAAVPATNSPIHVGPHRKPTTQRPTLVLPKLRNFS